STVGGAEHVGGVRLAGPDPVGVEFHVHGFVVLRQNRVRVAWRASVLMGRPETREAGGRLLGSRSVGVLGPSAAPRTVENGARSEGKQSAAPRAMAAVRASRSVLDYAACRAYR